MKMIPKSVTRTLKKVGEEVTINWPALGFEDEAGEPLVIYALVESQNVSIGEGKWDRKLVATLPATERDITGATLTRKVNGQTYQVTAYDQGMAGENVAYQEVILV